MVKNKKGINRDKLHELVTILNKKVNILDLIKHMKLPIVEDDAIIQTLCPYHNDTKAYNNGHKNHNFLHCFCCKINKTPVGFWKDYYKKTTVDVIKDLAAFIQFDLAPYYE